MRRLFILPILLLGLSNAACATSGVEPFGKLRDRTTNCGKSSYIRTTDTGTEVFLFGASRPELATPNPVPIDPVTGEERPTCMVYAFIEHDSSTVVEQGSYTMSASGDGLFTIVRRSTFVYEPDVSVLSRKGAQQEDPQPPLPTRELAVAVDGEELLVTLDGEKRRVTNLYDVISQVDATTQAGAEDIFRLLNVPLFTSQARIDKFGSANMITYRTSPGTFEGLVMNRFTVAMKKGIEVTISYDGFEDLHGISISGDQLTMPDIKGNGSMSGVLDFTMRSSETTEDVVIDGSLDYGNIKIARGVAGGGFYTLIVKDRSFEISYELATDVDLRGLLEPSTP